MNKLFCLLLAGSVIFSSYTYNGSTTAAVSLVGGVIKAKHTDREKKYPRKDCPVCKGTGKYLSGDGIKMVDCGYCEPETKTQSQLPSPPKRDPQCDNGNCKQPERVIIVR